MKLSKNFSSSEFECPCMACSDKRALGNEMVNPVSDLISKLQTARDILGHSIIITSGVRCKAHNNDPDVGGSEFSSHLGGLAADIKCEHSRQRWDLVDALKEAGFTRIGPKKTFVHCDVDPNKPTDVLWL